MSQFSMVLMEGVVTVTA